MILAVKWKTIAPMACLFFKKINWAFFWEATLCLHAAFFQALSVFQRSTNRYRPNQSDLHTPCINMISTSGNLQRELNML